MEPNTPKEKFNRKHSSIRNVIERSFGLLKMKWEILYRIKKYPTHVEAKNDSCRLHGSPQFHW
jgi:hypothetical protein